MSMILNYLPLIMDILCVLFLCWCVKAGYDGGLKYALDSLGTIIGIVLAGWATKILGPFTEPVVDVIAKFIAKAGVNENTIATVFGIVALFVVFAIFFVIIASIWRVIARLLETRVKKFKNTSIDKGLGAVIEAVLAVIFIIFIGVVLYRWTGLVSEANMSDTMIYSRLLNIK